MDISDFYSNFAPPIYRAYASLEAPLGMSAGRLLVHSKDFLGHPEVFPAHLRGLPLCTISRIHKNPPLRSLLPSAASPALHLSGLLPFCSLFPVFFLSFKRQQQGSNVRASGRRRRGVTTSMLWRRHKKNAKMYGLGKQSPPLQAEGTVRKKVLFENEKQALKGRQDYRQAVSEA